MTQFYSPFVDITGQPLKIKDVCYRHLKQLVQKGIKQGNRVQYQKVWNKTFRNEQLGSVICSFANTNGGWLIVGCDGAQITHIDKQRSDFNLTITELLREHVTPMPLFECRFLASSDPLVGVLIIYIREGLDQPYVCDSTTYTRNASTALPIPSLRTGVDGLSQKKELMRFCNERTFENNQKTAMCSVSLYNISKQKYMTNLESDQIKKCMMATAGFSRCATTMNSMVFFRDNDYSPESCSLEIYKDYSVKIYQPLQLVSRVKRPKIRKRIRQADKKIDIRQFVLLDGIENFTSLHKTLKLLFGILRKSGIQLDSYIVVFQFKNIRNSILFFECDDNTYYQCVCEKGLCFAIKNSDEGAPLRLAEYIGEKDGHTAYTLLADGFVSAFGISDLDFAEIYIKAKDFLTPEIPVLCSKACNAKGREKMIDYEPSAMIHVQPTAV